MIRPVLISSYWLIFLSCMLTSRLASAQNLVPNPSFETYNACPNGLSTITYDPLFATFPFLVDWVRPNNETSDYFNRCATATVGVPNNIFGYQQPHTGNAYVGMYGYIGNGTGLPYREFVSTKFQSALKKDSLYCVSFYVNQAVSNAFATQTKIATNNVAAFISDTLPTNIPTPSMDPGRFIMNDTSVHLDDTAIWYQVRGQYLAKGGERWLTIGVFYDGNMPPYSIIAAGTPGQYLSYVFVDDVSVAPSSIQSKPTTVTYCGEPLELTSSSNSGPHNWSTGATGKSIIVNAPGTYICTTLGDCNTVRDSFTVLPTPVADSMPKRVIRHCSPPGWTQKLTASMAGDRYTWSTGETTKEITVTASGSYVCEVFSNCRIYPLRYEVSNDMPDPPVLRDTVVCRDSKSLLIQTGYDDIVWYTAAGAGPLTTQPAIRRNETGQAMLYAGRRNGQCLSARVPIAITIKAAPSQRLTENILRCSDRPGEMQLGLNTSADDTYAWSTGETSLQIPLPVLDGKYTRTVTNMCGTAVDSFHVSSGRCNDCVVFPNAFTPNGDGRNDGFNAMLRCPADEFLLQIYNRWGQMIFVGSKPDMRWDGTQGGNPAPVETYMYQCSFRNPISGEIIRSRGDVLLIR